MQVGLNKEFFKRGSTWLNITECVAAVGVELVMGLPEGAGLAYIGLRVLMAVVQGIKVEARNGLN